MGYGLWGLKELDITEQLRMMGLGGGATALCLGSKGHSTALTSPWTGAAGRGHGACSLPVGLQPLGPGQVGRCRLAFHQGTFPLHR